MNDPVSRRCPRCGKLHEGLAPSGWCHTCLWLLGERKGAERRAGHRTPPVAQPDDPYAPEES